MDWIRAGVETGGCGPSSLRQFGPTVTCRCSFRDWAGLRRALGLTQAQFAAILSLSRQRVYYLETTGPTHSCHTRQTLLILRYQLQDPAYIAALAAAHYPHPFPGDNAS